MKSGVQDGSLGKNPLMRSWSCESLRQSEGYSKKCSLNQSGTCIPAHDVYARSGEGLFVKRLGERMGVIEGLTVAKKILGKKEETPPLAKTIALHNSRGHETVQEGIKENKMDSKAFP